MNIYDFRSWLHQRERRRREHVPAADLVVPLVAHAGPAGMTRSEIGKAIGGDLDHDAVDDLLAGLVGFGLLTIARENGLFVYRATGVRNSPAWSRLTASESKSLN